jgi:hypothetical protein
MAGYSARSLVQKLGIRPESRIAILNAPRSYTATLGRLPEGVTVARAARGQFTFIQFFTKARSELRAKLPILCRALRDDGALWISWPKQAARVRTDVTEDVIRDLALPLGLVDVKVCAVDDTWSGLKLVRRRERRTLPVGARP